MKAVLGHKKKVNKRFLLALIAMLTIGGIAAAQADVGPWSISNIVNMDISIPFEDYAFIVKNDHSIMFIDGEAGSFSGVYNYHIIMIPKGFHVLTYFYYQPITFGSDFESGKYYYIKADLESKFLKQDKIIVSVEEVTDTSKLETAKQEIELAKVYYDWTLSNIKMMEGTYQTEDRQQQIIFSENKFEYNHKKSKTNYKGVFFFNGDKMFMRVDSKNNKMLKRINITNGSNISLLTYKLENKLFDIMTNRRYFSGNKGKSSSIIGEYYKE